MRKEVHLKIRGGDVCSCPVKYENLPLICFYCGRFSHGTSDCREVFGDSSPVKLYGPWLKASPWKPLTQEEMYDDKEKQISCGKNLFFTKKVGQHVTLGGPKEHQVEDVTCLFQQVALDNSVKENIERQEAPARATKDTGLGSLDGYEMDGTSKREGHTDMVNNSAWDQANYSGQLVREESFRTTENSMGCVRDDQDKRVALTSKRVQRWRKMAREHAPQKSLPSFYPHVGEKRSNTEAAIDEPMLDVEVGVKIRKDMFPWK